MKFMTILKGCMKESWIDYSSNRKIPLLVPLPINAGSLTFRRKWENQPIFQSNVGNSKARKSLFSKKGDLEGFSRLLWLYKVKNTN
jgi:hypothetical protein